MTRDLVITRIFDAPRELVWRAWTDPQQMMRWWGPPTFTTPVCSMDLRVGGKYLYCMQSPEGQQFWSTGIYREIAPPELLVFTDSFADEQGNVVAASHYGMGDDFPLEMVVTVTLEAIGDQTKMTLRHEGLPAGEMGDMTMEGWNGSFDKLADSLRQPDATAVQPYSALTTLFRHNLWANLDLLAVCATLSEEQLQTVIPGGYGSIGNTWQHLVHAERSYFTRVSTGQRYRWPDDGDPPLTFAEMAASLQHTGEGLTAWASNVGDTDRVQVQWDNGPIQGPVQVPKAVILAQAINHATEHRAQIMAILTHLGIQPPELDLWLYFELQELR
jgi:uncharacterized protein YndB with AHSA1/START domain/uncharacterized damage-inducible protein DinB